MVAKDTINTYTIRILKKDPNKVCRLYAWELQAILKWDAEHETFVETNLIKRLTALPGKNIYCGAGSSSFDEKFRPNELINSPEIWNDKEYVKSIFEKAGIN